MPQCPSCEVMCPTFTAMLTHMRTGCPLHFLHGALEAGGVSDGETPPEIYDGVTLRPMDLGEVAARIETWRASQHRGGPACR
ncbi:MAG TPA: hypothetical protein VNP04_15670 [Alphaproteobacteria bacterium]|nr:hypothetical protein [Alphaproteobacteria bacterium]